jgi:hypothetical protein
MTIVRIARLGVAFAVAFPTVAMGREANLVFDIPRPANAEWHRPFVAIWVEDAAGRQVRQIGVFHDRTRIGARWLPELRQWWRQGGRSLQMPADGISRATPAAGIQTVPLGMVTTLPDGQYAIVIEAAREKGGHELLRMPIRIAKGVPSTAKARGRTELGATSIGKPR